jgi:YVTN family beta-propeller protein
MKTLSAAVAITTALVISIPAGVNAASRSSFIQADYAKLRVAPLATVADGSITVDGDLSDWRTVVPVRDGVIDDVLDHTVGSLNGDVRDAATFRFAHDDHAVYAAVQVADSSVVPSSTEIYNGDAVEFFFDFRPIDPATGPKLGDSGYTDGCYQIMVAAPVNGSTLRHEAKSGGTNLGPYDVAAKPVDGGYAVELRIPFTSLAGVDAARMTQPFGFDVSVDDIDLPRVLGVAGYVDVGSAITPRRSFAWSGDADQWRDASAFGIADPDFTDLAPTPLLRTSPAVYTRGDSVGLDGKRSVILAGDVAPIRTAETKTDFQVKSVPSGKFGTSHVEIADYPGLGVSIRRTWWPSPALAAGRYKLVTHYNAGFRQTVSASVTGGPASLATGKPFPVGTEAANEHDSGAYLLPNGRRITPAGKHIPLPGDMPESFVWLDKTHLAVNTGGFHNQGVDVIDTATNKVIQTLPLRQTWGSMAFFSAGRILLVPGAHTAKGTDINREPSFVDALPSFYWDTKSLTKENSYGIAPVPVPPGNGAPVDSDIYVAGVAGNNWEEPYVININSDKLYHLMLGYYPSFRLKAYSGTAYRPSAVTLSPDSKVVTVANWGDASVVTYDASTLTKIASIKVGSHPVALTYSPGIWNGGNVYGLWKGHERLFVACSGSNSVDVIEYGRVTETIKTSLNPNDLAGSTPIAVAVSPDGQRLYVANADNNDICVADISMPGHSRVIGFIPTGWYPSALTVSADGRKLYVGVGKGLHFSENVNGTYIPNLLNGAVSVIDLPSATHLAAYTKQVVANNAPLAKPASRTGLASLRGKIKHVLYIIRENRTYDQVLGDDPRGNGDPKLTMFGRDITPNVHKLVNDYALLDNVYCNGEVSESGHQWCDAAYATDFVERAWINSYSGKDEPDADDRLTASPAGYLWDNCRRHGLTYYSYGEFSLFHSSPKTAPIYDGEGTLSGHCNQAYGLLAWEDRDTLRSKIFVDDLHKAEKTGQWPQFIVMSLPEDHTHGLGTASYTPAACVASNDLAVGQIVEAVSHSRFWKDTAIFVIEDDAQDGQDHVDAHRTVGLVISPYVKHGAIDHTFYTTASFVRTMEDILGLPPMTQFDKNATPMGNAFDPAPVMTAYAQVPPHIDIMAKNQAGPAAVESAKLDFSAPDRADPDTLNRLLWQAMKPGVPMPAPVRSGVFASR